jgi:Putative transmembrane protein (PGPGW)
MSLNDLTWSHLGWGLFLSALLLVSTAFVGGVVLIWLPANYFTRRSSNWRDQHPLVYWSLLVGKNLLGVVLIVAGVLMLVLPGQGLLTILIGLLLMSFPGKRKLVARLIERAHLLGTMNRLRGRFGRPPLELGRGELVNSTR